jgi:hypothetical protein
MLDIMPQSMGEVCHHLGNAGVFIRILHEEGKLTEIKYKEFKTRVVKSLDAVLRDREVDAVITHPEIRKYYIEIFRVAKDRLNAAKYPEGIEEAASIVDSLQRILY